MPFSLLSDSDDLYKFFSEWGKKLLLNLHILFMSNFEFSVSRNISLTLNIQLCSK